jgi:hypothetical protein
MRITASSTSSVPGAVQGQRQQRPRSPGRPGQAEEELYASFWEGDVLRRPASCAVSPASLTQNSD